MKIKLALTVSLLVGVTILMPATATAQGPLTPDEVVGVLVETGLLDTTEGELVLEVEEETVDVSTEDNFFSYIYYEEVDAENVILSADITWGPGAAEDDCGFLLRAADQENYYYIGMSQENQVRFDEIDGGEWQEAQFFDSTSTTAGKGKTNNLLVIALPGTMIVLVNNELVTQIDDDTHSGGWVGVGMDTYESSTTTNCVFSNIWAWEPAESSSGGSLTDMLGGSSGSDEVQLAAYDAEPAVAIRELEKLGFVPSGGSQVFLEDYAYFNGAGSFFTPLARNSPFTNVVMAGELTFTVGSTAETETCTLMARVISGASGSDTYIEVGLDNSGRLYGIDLVGGEMVMGEYFAEDISTSAPHHVMFIINGDQLDVFLDGALVASEIQLDTPRSGTFGIALVGTESDAKCEGRNIWVYQLD